MRIHVEDANDNAPAFVGEDQFLAQVKEEQDEGLLVTQLYAQDVSTGKGAESGGHSTVAKWLCNRLVEYWPTGPLARPFACSLTSLDHSLASPCPLRLRAPLRLFICSPELVGK